MCSVLAAARRGQRARQTQRQQAAAITKVQAARRGQEQRRSVRAAQLEARLAQMSGRTSFKLLSPRTRAGGGGVPHPPLGLLRGSVLQRPPAARSSYPTYMAPLGHPRTSRGPLADASTPHMVNLNDPAGGRGHIARRLKKKGEKLDLLRADIQRSMSEHT